MLSDMRHVDARRTTNWLANRLTASRRFFFQAKADAAQKEKYYELIMNCVNTGIIVLDDNGVIYQTNNEALRLLGLAVFTNVRQLARIDENLKPSYKTSNRATSTRYLLPMNVATFTCLSVFRK